MASNYILGDYDFNKISPIHSMALWAAPAASKSCDCSVRFGGGRVGGPLFYDGKPDHQYLQQLAEKPKVLSPCAQWCHANEKTVDGIAACRLGCIAANTSVPAEDIDPAGPCVEACARSCNGNIECLAQCARLCVLDTLDQRVSRCEADMARELLL